MYVNTTLMCLYTKRVVCVYLYAHVSIRWLGVFTPFIITLCNLLVSSLCVCHPLRWNRNGHLQAQSILFILRSIYILYVRISCYLCYLYTFVLHTSSIFYLFHPSTFPTLLLLLNPLRSPQSSSTPP